MFTDDYQLTGKEWWEERRLLYNIGLVAAGVLAFICYAFVDVALISPHDTEDEISIFTIVFQGIGYLCMIGVANIFYLLGYFVDNKYNKKNSDVFRVRLFRLGFWFSFMLPFSIPVLLILKYSNVFR